MDEKTANYIINEFTNKARELERSKFVRLVLEDIRLTNEGKESLFRFGLHITEDKEGEATVSIKNETKNIKHIFKAKIEPDIRYINLEFFRSAIPLIRMFIQHDETISIANLAQAYQILAIREYYRKTIANDRRWLKEKIVDAKWEIGGEEISHWDILHTFVYSNVLHSDMKKKEIWDGWLKKPELHGPVFQSLHLSTGLIAIKVIGFARLNEAILHEMEKSKNYRSILFLVEEEDFDLKSKSLEELKQIASYALYDMDQKIFNKSINDKITIYKEKFLVIWKHVNSENNSMIGIYRCIRIR